MKKYATEREGQIDFFKNFHIDYENNDVLIDNTDGVWNGNLFEFKKNIDNLNKVLLQAIKYLSRMRIKGDSVPANILLVSLNDATLYLYHSQDYFQEIHKVYSGAASRDNEGFIAKKYVAKYQYFSNYSDTIAVQSLLKSTDFMPIQIDENCIVGWAERYYRDNPVATKGDFIGDDEGKIKIVGEIRDPKYFKGLILPYTGKTNEKFKYLMDKLNDRLQKKDLGAFYTPISYCEKAAELLRIAIARVPEGNDYIILDRCAGTGNLESVLSDEELSHCILSTYEYYEYKVLCERLQGKVRFIIPPTEDQVTYAHGCVLNADAMSKEYIEIDVIQQYIKNPKCTIILYENPPYQDSTAITFVDKGTSERAVSKRKGSYIQELFKKEVKKYGSAQASVREISNLFIWSAFEFYLRQPTDSYVVFSPVKYFKNIGLAQNKFVKGYLFNRKHFHATASAISCILWANVDDRETKEWDLEALDIAPGQENLESSGMVKIKWCSRSISQLQDNRPVDNGEETSCVCGTDGYPKTDYVYTTGRKPIYSDDVIAYMSFNRITLNALNYNLVRCNLYKGLKECYGFHLRRDNYLLMLPPFCAKLFPQDKWYEKEVYFTTADGGEAYKKDKELLKSCLIYTCLTNQNKCVSFQGVDGRMYQNELCFEEGAAAYEDFRKLRDGGQLNAEEVDLLALWDKILLEARQTENYDPQLRYGVYQITRELNTFHMEDKNKVPDYRELNGDLDSLRARLKVYYKKYITPKMFHYELLK